MTKRNRNILLILFAFGIIILGGCLYFMNKFLNALAPNKITITKTEIRSSDGFINPITIEKLKVDSIGIDKRPVKYIIEYFTTCGIKQIAYKPPIPIKEIKLNDPGRYSWSEENVNIQIVHNDGYSKRVSSVERLLWSEGSQNFDICPLKFENQNWYFINFLDPQIVGIYIYIDNSGVLQQYVVYSGVSPI